MMKKVITGAFALMLLLTLTMPAHADVMWEPRDNPYYEKHRNECEYENRGYYANGNEGFVTLLDAPNGSTVRAQYKNGEVLWVAYTHDNWALINRWDGETDLSGWAAMSDLKLKYDCQSFMEEYAEKIHAYSGEFADYDDEIEEINFYAYPGAPEIEQTMELSGWGGDVIGKLKGSSEEPSYIQSVFTDEDGRTWGYISYLYGIRSIWFCLDEPGGENFPIREVSVEELTPAQEPILPAVSYVPYILVAAVVVVTAGILVYFYGKRKKASK